MNRFDCNAEKKAIRIVFSSLGCSSKQKKSNCKKKAVGYAVFNFSFHCSLGRRVYLEDLFVQKECRG